MLTAGKARTCELRAVPPLRQKQTARTGHGAFVAGQKFNWRRGGLYACQLVASQLVPRGHAFRHRRCFDTGRDAGDYPLRLDNALGFTEHSFDPAHSGKAVAAGEGLFNVEPTLVPANKAGSELEGGKERKRAAVGNPNGTYERLPARVDDVFEQLGAGQQMGARIVHDAEVAGVVHVEIDVDVVGQDMQAEPVFFKDGERRKRLEVLANGEGRNADKADEVGQAVLLCATSVGPV